MVQEEVQQVPAGHQFPAYDAQESPLLLVLHSWGGMQVFVCVHWLACAVCAHACCELSEAAGSCWGPTLVAMGAACSGLICQDIMGQGPWQDVYDGDIYYTILDSYT